MPLKASFKHIAYTILQDLKWFAAAHLGILQCNYNHNKGEQLQIYILSL